MEGGVESGDGFGPGINSDFRRLQVVVEQFCARPDEPVLPHQIGEQMEHLAHVRDLLERELARLAAVFAKSHEAERQGSNGEVEWLRHHGQMAFSRASELVVVGNHLGEMPQSSAALEAGRVGFGHLVHIARNARFCAGSETAHFSTSARCWTGRCRRASVASTTPAFQCATCRTRRG